MGIFDELPLTAQEEMFNKVKGSLLTQLTVLANECNIDIDDISMEFKDPDFLTKFFQTISPEEQKKYLQAAYNFDHGNAYDHNYLLVFRRAIYTDYAKNESFWSTDFNQPRFGLKKEQPLNSPVRLYSSIMVSTMGKQIKHGLVELENGGATDGEIAIDATRPFADFLFVYKPVDEIEELHRYSSSGGITHDELLERLKETSKERMHLQGFRN